MSIALGNGNPDITEEVRVALIHRVLVPAEDHPKEYIILVTDRRAIFILQPKTRSSFVLRGEMRYGTALVTDVVPKTLEDYRQVSLDSLASGSGNFAVSHEAITSFAMGKEEPKFCFRDIFVWLTMRRQGEIFQVYKFEMNFRESVGHDARIKFYAVPLGMYFKPRRVTESRETILREYALGVLSIFQKVLPAAAKAQ